MQLEDPRIRYRQLQNEASTESIPFQTSSQVNKELMRFFVFLPSQIVYVFLVIQISCFIEHASRPWPRASIFILEIVNVYWIFVYCVPIFQLYFRVRFFCVCFFFVQPMHASPYHVYPTNQPPAYQAFHGPNTSSSIHSVSASPLLASKIHQHMVSVGEMFHFKKKIIEKIIVFIRKCHQFFVWEVQVYREFLINLNELPSTTTIRKHHSWLRRIQMRPSRELIQCFRRPVMHTFGFCWKSEFNLHF